MEKIFDNHIITQIGIVVKDIEETSKRYAALFGIEKPEAKWTDVQEIAHTKYNGKPTPARAKLAFINMGSVQLELIEPDEHPSTWREYLDENGEGVHHIAFQVKGMKEKVALFEKNEMRLIQSGEYTGGRYAYIDSLKAIKVMVELLEND